MKCRTPVYLLITALVVAALGGQWFLLRARSPKGAEGHAGDAHSGVSAAQVSLSLVTSAATSSDVVVKAPAPAQPTVPAHRAPGYQPQVATGIVDHQGNATSVACMTCHSIRAPNVANGADGVLPKEFHQGQAYAHGGQSSLSCHHAEDYDALRLADGRKLAFSDAQKLCAQCHGPQTRDYLHGSHGGMRGYWDQTKGARTRNTCTDCHDPHAPAYPILKPIFSPRDAGARQQAERDAAHARANDRDHSDSSAHE